MGVPIGEADGDYPALLRCLDCNQQFETDETMHNNCPHCNSFRVENDTPTGEMDDVYDPSYWRE